jgi:virulence-associated protein VagC
MNLDGMPQVDDIQIISLEQLCVSIIIYKTLSMSYNMFDISLDFLYHMNMNTKTITFTQDNTKRISIREYIRNYKVYNNEVKLTGERIIITNQDNDEVVLSPAQSATKKRKWTFEDLEKGFFNAGKNTSKNIDKIVYGI